MMAFQKFIKDYDCLIHFNGNSFDIPFVKERAEKYALELQDRVSDILGKEEEKRNKMDATSDFFSLGGHK